MPSLSDSVKRTFSRFTYKRDEGGDRWQFLSSRGRIEGDCEDFVLTVMQDYFGTRKRALKALLRGESSVWYCKLRGSGHALGQVNGRFFDNSGAIYDSTRQMPDTYTAFKRCSLLKLAVKIYPKQCVLALLLLCGAIVALLI